ncbi:MAG: ABC transporter permease [Actinomycetota bacterium]
MTVTIAALGPAVSRSVIDATVRSRVADAPADRSGVELLVRAPADEAGPLDAAISSATAASAGAVEGADARIVVTDSYDAVRADGAPFSGDTALTFRLGALETDRPLLRGVDGTSPRPGATPVEASLHVDAARTIGVGVGDPVRLERGAASIDLVIVEIVEPVDASDPLWFGSTLVRDGVVPGRQFTEIGPVLVPPADLARVDRGAAHRWRRAVAVDALGESDLDALEALPDRLRADLDRASIDGEVDTGLDELVEELRPTLSSTRSAVLVVVLQLVAMAVPAISVATGALVSAREPGNSLLRARGIRPTQLTRASAVEAGVVVGVAVVVAPLLAAAATEAVERLGPVADAGLDLRATLPPTSWLAAAAAGLVVLALLVWPVHRQATSFTETRRRRARASGQDLVERWGIDLALAAVALLGLVQLRSSGSPLSDDLRGRLDVDPVLVVAPALGLVAAGLLALRIVRFVGSAAAQFATRARGLHGALAAWQTARRPGRTRRVALLVVVAVAVATYAVVFGATWERARVDQAGARVGADVVAEFPTRDGAGVPAGVATSLALALPGVSDSMLVSRHSGTVGGDDGPITVLAVDAEHYGDVVRGDDRLLDDAEPIVELAGARRPLVGSTLPDGLATIELTATVEVVAGSVDDDLALTALLVDADGTPWRSPATTVSPAGRSDVEVPLTTSTVDGDVAPPGPVELVGWELDVPAPDLRPPPDTPPQEREPTRDPPELIVSLTAAPPLTDELLFDPDWSTTFEATRGTGLLVEGGVRRMPEPGLVLDVAAGTNRDGSDSTVVLLSPSAAGPMSDDPVPIVLGAPVAGRTGLVVGEEIAVSSGVLPLDGMVTAIVDGIPSVLDGEVVVVDGPTLAARRFRDDRTVRAPTELALAVDERSHLDVGEALARTPVEATVTDRRRAADEAAGDATTVGILAMFTFGALAAAVVAGIGLTVAATADARERAAELAVLEALGITTNGVRRILVSEAMLVVAVSVVLGIGTGVALGLASVEALTVGADGLAVVPEPVLRVPAGAVAAIGAVAAAAVIVLPQLTVAARRERHAATVLRSGEAA